MPRLSIGLLAAMILIGISYFTAKMYSLGMGFEGVATRLTFFVFLIIPLLFAGSIMIARSGAIGVSMYRDIQVLAGFGFYVFLGAIVLGVCLLIACIGKHELPAGIAWGIFALSLVTAGIGFVQSKYIKTVSYTIMLTAAPTSWDGKTAVLVSDTHFGLVNHKTFSNKVVDAILKINPDFVLHAGDFYDGPAINTVPITESWKRLTAAIPVLYAPGNHEAYGDYAGFLDSIRAANITVLDDKKIDFEGVTIAGITYRDGKNPVEAATAIASLGLDRTTPTILINHPPTSLEAAEKNGVDLQVSGHTHNGQFWPMTYMVRKIYGPYYYGHRMYGTMQTITSSGVGTFGPPLRLFNPPELVVITFKTGK